MTSLMPTTMAILKNFRASFGNETEDGFSDEKLDDPDADGNTSVHIDLSNEEGRKTGRPKETPASPKRNESPGTPDVGRKKGNKEGSGSENSNSDEKKGNKRKFQKNNNNNKNKNSPRPTRGILHGLSSLRRDGNVQVIKDGEKARIVRAKFLLGPVALEILPKVSFHII